MILVIKLDNGESWDDYRIYVNNIIDIDTTKTKEDLYDEWKSWFVDHMKINKDISIDPIHIKEPIGFITLQDKCSDEYKMYYSIIEKELKKSKNSFCAYLKRNYKVIDVKYETIHDYCHKIK